MIIHVVLLIGVIASGAFSCFNPENFVVAFSYHLMNVITNFLTAYIIIEASKLKTKLKKNIDLVKEH